MFGGKKARFRLFCNQSSRNLYQIMPNKFSNSQGYDDVVKTSIKYLVTDLFVFTDMSLYIHSLIFVHICKHMYISIYRYIFIYILTYTDIFAYIDMFCTSRRTQLCLEANRAKRFLSYDRT